MDVIPNLVEVEKEAHAAAVKAACEVLSAGKIEAMDSAHHLTDAHEQFMKMKDILKETVMEFCENDLVPALKEKISEATDGAASVLGGERLAKLVASKFEAAVPPIIDKLMDMEYDPSHAREALSHAREHLDDLKVSVRAGAMDMTRELAAGVAGDLVDDLKGMLPYMEDMLPEGVDIGQFQDAMGKANAVLQEAAGTSLEDVGARIQEMVTGPGVAFKEAVENALSKNGGDPRAAYEAGLAAATEDFGSLPSSSSFSVPDEEEREKLKEQVEEVVENKVYEYIEKIKRKIRKFVRIRAGGDRAEDGGGGEEGRARRGLAADGQTGRRAGAARGERNRSGDG